MPEPVLPSAKNFLGLAADRSDLDSAAVVLQLEPFEQTSTFGEGSARGPAALLAASREVELFDAELGFEPWVRCGGIATLAAPSRGPTRQAPPGGADVAASLEVRTAELLDWGKFVVTLGGEHTSIVGAAWAHAARAEDLTVVQFDAHSDLRPEYGGTPWNHACAASRIRERVPRIVQVGIRSQDAGERALIEEQRIPVIYAHEMHAASPSSSNPLWLDRLIEACSQNVYITFDFDALDPSCMPATGTPEPGGITWTQATLALRQLCERRNVVGVDFSELSPIPGLHHPEFTAAKLVYRFLGLRFA